MAFDFASRGFDVLLDDAAAGCDVVPFGNSVDLEGLGDFLLLLAPPAEVLGLRPSVMSLSRIRSAYDPRALKTDVEDEGERGVEPLG